MLHYSIPKKIGYFILSAFLFINITLHIKNIDTFDIIVTQIS